MTKYILVGGYIKKTEDGGKAFCEELVKGLNLSRPVKILDCMFARPAESWQEKLKEDQELFSKYISNFELELADVSKFVEQVKSSDVIFLRGGHTVALMEALNKNSDWMKYLDGKTVAGTSAGMDAISKYAYDIDTLELADGLGLLQVKSIPHWRSDYNSPNVDWDNALKLLKEYKEDLPIYTLGEGEFVVIHN